VISLFFLTRRDYAQERELPREEALGDKFRRFTNEFFFGFPFEASFLSYGKLSTYILLATRIASFLFYLAVPCIWRYVKDAASGAHLPFFSLFPLNAGCISEIGRLIACHIDSLTY
jgi:hypothetical protein